MIRVDARGQQVTDEELAVVIAAALEASQAGPEVAVDLSGLDDSGVAAIVAAIAAAGLPLQQREAPRAPVSTAWRRPSYEQSVRPRWR
ncbi:MAG: hypothetical protein ACPL2N_01105 [Candidatus Cryosericum sp.]